MRTGGFWGPNLRPKGEKKTIDVDSATYAADTTGTVTLLSEVATGTDFTDRIGRKINMKSVYVRGFLSPVDTTTSFCLSRLLIVYDNQPNGAAPAITDILKAATSVAQVNLNNRDRFKILIDKQFPLGNNNNTATQAISGSPNVHHVKVFRRLNLIEQFGGTTAAVGSITTGAIWMVTVGDNAAADGGVFKLCTRIRFTDA